MKSTLQKLIFAATTLFVACGNALAKPCGAAPLDPCALPEPSTLPMIIGAIGIAAAIVKLRK